MNEFRTLRGFVACEEPDEPDYFAHSASLRIFGDDLDFNAIERALGVSPTRTRRKGDRAGPRSPAAKRDASFFEPDLPEDRPLHEHIDALWSAIHHAAPFLRDLKSTADIDVFLGYRSNIDHAGFEVPHSSLEMFRVLEIPFGVSVIVC